MIVVRNVFQLKFGRAKEAIDLWKEGLTLAKRLGFTAKTLSLYGPFSKFSRTVRPTLPLLSVAPMTATFWGAKKASRALPEEVRVDARFTMLSVPIATIKLLLRRVVPGEIPFSL